MAGHIVGTLVSVGEIGIVVGNEPIEIVLKIASSGGVGVFHQHQAAACMTTKNHADSVSGSRLGQGFLSLARKVVGAFAFRSDCQLALKKTHGLYLVWLVAARSVGAGAIFGKVIFLWLQENGEFQFPAGPFYGEKEKVAGILKKDAIAKVVQIEDRLAIDSRNNVFGLQAASLGRASSHYRLNQYLSIDIVFVSLFFEFYGKNPVSYFLIRFQLFGDSKQRFGGYDIRRLHFREGRHDDSDQFVVGVKGGGAAFRWANRNAKPGVCHGEQDFREMALESGDQAELGSWLKVEWAGHREGKRTNFPSLLVWTQFYKAEILG